MRPVEIAKSDSESAHQQAFFAWCNIAAQWGIKAALEWRDGAVLPPKPSNLAFYPLRWIFHIPNGGARGDSKQSNMIRGGKLKAEGTKKGILDIFWPYPLNGYHGLWIEMKEPKKRPKTERNLTGGLTEKQIEFGTFAHNNNFKVEVAYDWREAINILLHYLQYKY